MTKITYRIRHRCVDSYRVITVPTAPIPIPDTSLYYIKTNRFNYLVLGKDDIISMEEI